MNEEWKPVVGFEGAYEVSSHGRVRSLHRNAPIIMTTGDNGKGYVCLNLRPKKGKPKKFYVHRLVLTAFKGVDHDNKEVNHINGIKSDNTLANLEWCTHKRNLKHAYDIGLHPGPNAATISVGACCPIKGELLHTFESIVFAAECAGVSTCGISNCIAGRQKTAAGFTWVRI